MEVNAGHLRIWLGACWFSGADAAGHAPGALESGIMMCEAATKGGAGLS